MRRSACLEAIRQLSLRKLEHGLCGGIACSKGVPSGNNQNEDHCRCGGAVLSDRTLHPVNVRFRATANPPQTATLGAKQTKGQISLLMFADSRRWKVGVEKTGVSREHFLKLAVRCSAPLTPDNSTASPDDPSAFWPSGRLRTR
jgi:hypothetical protein